jgi:CheY-like chemotaxis protein
LTSEVPSGYARCLPLTGSQGRLAAKGGFPLNSTQHTMSAKDPVLLVEDNEDDVFFFQRAWQIAGVPNPLAVVTDGQQAIDYLAGNGPYADRERHPAPAVVLLDLKLPFKNGHEVLRWIRSRPEGARTVVVFLTSSRERTDVSQAYEAGANGYLVKPANTAQLADMVRAVKAYWLDFNVV